THYLTVASNTINDAMFGVDYLAIYPKIPVGPTSVEQTGDSNIQVYPTVTDGNIQVNLGDKSGIITVYDITGKLIQTKTANSSIETLTLASKGMYVVEIKTSNTTKTVKVIKVK
ncbi:MAG: T9SS type A sorting domain-containing protein, partial [Paludibacter sp.]